VIPRYTREKMGALWSEEHKYQTWLQVELLACEAWAELGEIPREAVQQIKERARIDPHRIDEIERKTKHDVAAFVAHLEETVGDEGKYIHYGLTSYDIVDTALSLRLREAAEIIIEDIDDLLEAIREKAFKHRETVMIGRTHGVHAEPITFGLKMALWYEEMRRHRARMERARDSISVGKLSGAVGTFANAPPSIEEYVCKKLGLKPAPVSSQIIQRDRHAEFFTTLALLASSIEKFAVEIRHLQRTEVLEAEEPFVEGQKGSSAMPHKRNPIGTENLSGLARLVRGNAWAAMENIPLWHERDISHSSVERVIAPDHDPGGLYAGPAHPHHQGTGGVSRADAGKPQADQRAYLLSTAHAGPHSKGGCPGGCLPLGTAQCHAGMAEGNGFLPISSRRQGYRFYLDRERNPGGFRLEYPPQICYYYI
jgi:adenylosuccinate lyase